MIKNRAIIYLVLALVIIPSAHLHSDNDKPVPAKNEKKMSLWTKLALAGTAIGTAATGMIIYVLYSKPLVLSPEERDVANLRLNEAQNNYQRLVAEFRGGELRNVADKREGNMLTSAELKSIQNQANAHAINFLAKQPAYEKYRDALMKCKYGIIECIDNLVKPFAPDMALLMKKDVYNNWTKYYNMLQLQTIDQIREDLNSRGSIIN